MTESPNNPAQISSLLRYFKEAAEEKRLELKEQTEAEITSIQDRAAAQKLERLEEAKAALDRQENEILESTLRRARIDCDLRVKRKMGNAVDCLLKKATSGLPEFVSGDQFTPILEHLLVEAVNSGMALRKSTEGSLGSLKVNPAHETVAKELVAKNGFNVDVVLDPSVIGGVVQTVDGTPYTITNTLASRLSKLDSDVRMAIAGRLNQKVGDNN